MKAKRLTMGKTVSRTFDMRCFRVMTDAFRKAAPGMETMDRGIAGVAELFETEIDDLLDLPPEIFSVLLMPLMEEISRWYDKAAAAGRKEGGGVKMITGDPILAIYADLMSYHGILPDEIDRQDPETFLSVRTEEHITSKDIPEGVEDIDI